MSSLDFTAAKYGSPFTPAEREEMFNKMLAANPANAEAVDRMRKANPVQAPAATMSEDDWNLAHCQPGHLCAYCELVAELPNEVAK